MPSGADPSKPELFVVADLDQVLVVFDLPEGNATPPGIGQQSSPPTK